MPVAARNRWRSSSPSMDGMATSRTATWGGPHSSTAARASGPDDAPRTWWPRARIWVQIRWRMSALSSTTRSWAITSLPCRRRGIAWYVDPIPPELQSGTDDWSTWRGPAPQPSILPSSPSLQVGHSGCGEWPVGLPVHRLWREHEIDRDPQGSGEPPDLAEGRHRLVGLPAADRGDVDAE